VRAFGRWIGFALVLGGVFLLVFTQVTRVFVDPRRTELVQNNTVGDTTNVILSAVLISVGFVLIMASVARAQGWSKAAALTTVGLSLLMLLMLHLTLFINTITVGTETDLGATFTAGYLFHNGDAYSVVAVFLLFLITIGLLGVFVTGLGVLLMPHRFSRALWDARDWYKNEAVVVGSGLLVVFGLAIFLVAIVRIVVQLTQEPVHSVSFLSQNLPMVYSLQALAIALLILTVSARVFLANWAVQIPIDVNTIRDTMLNVARVERVLVGAAVLFDLVVWIAPGTDASSVSHDPVFLLNSRGLALFFLLMAAPFLPYVLGLRRLNRLLAGGHPLRSTPFSQLSLRMVIAEFSGLVLLTAAGLGARWNALGIMTAYGAWTAGVFLVASVRVRLDRGLMEPELRGRGSGPLFFGFILVALTTGLMMWGAGNTYVGTYLESSHVLTVENASPYGADILFKLGGACLVSFTLLFSIAVARSASGVKRTLVGTQVSGFLSFVVIGLTAFTVNVWNKGNAGLEDAYAGFSFHQYYDVEKILVAIVVGVGSLVAMWAMARLLGPLVRGRPVFEMAPRVR
jgi:hypothetical protein